MEIREAEAADMPEVAELSRELAAHVGDPDPGADAKLLAECGFGPERWFECLIALVDARIVGYALYCRLFEAHTRAKRLWLGDLYVGQRARGIGVGRALVAALRKRAADLGCDAFSLELARGNDIARSFYESLGIQGPAGSICCNCLLSEICGAFGRELTSSSGGEFSFSLTFQRMEVPYWAPVNWNEGKLKMVGHSLKSAPSTPRVVTFSIAGMTCGHCAGTVNKALSKVNGVTRVQVDRSSGRAVVEGTARPEVLADSVRMAGYDIRTSDA
jgi:copper chaperone CopZ/GNAT superfamily N-acetyltransferase